jgi:5,10-methylenetetrahydromethanopterin reductase
MSARIRIGIAFQSNKTPREYEELAQIVDRYPFDVVSIYNDLMNQPAIGPLMLFARHVRRAQLGPAVLNPFVLHPVEIAGQIALLDMVTEGRAYLGIGRGAWLDAIDREPEHPITAIREAVELVRHQLAGRADGYEGKVFRLTAGAKLLYSPLRANVPIMIGTWGPRTCRLTGAIADELKIGGSANPAMVSHLRQFVDEGSIAAGRPAGSVGICLGAVTVIESDRKVAREMARRQVTPYVPVIASLDPSIQDHEWLRRVAAAGKVGESEAIAHDMPDGLLEKFAFAGDHNDLIRQIEGAIAAGATRVDLGTPHGANPADAIRMLGEKVLPYFRA